MRVLIADDNSDNLYMLESLLKGSGYEVLVACDGIEALQLLRTKGAGLIISDILMPKMDGFQLCREVRADERLRTIPFVFYTATYTSEKDEEFALGLGADRFILKPADPDFFIKIITEISRTAKNGLIEPATPSLAHESYLPEYTLRIKDKLEDKIAEVRQIERRYYNLFNSLRDVVIISNLDGSIIDANQPALRNTFGYEIEELQGSHYRKLHSEWNPAIFDNGSDTDDISEATFRRKDGTIFEGEVSCLKLIDDNGIASGNIAVIRDISTQKILEAQLQQARKMEAMGRLAGGIAHDFNNKLTVILGYVDMMKRFKPAWEEMVEKLDHVAQAAIHSRDMTRQLLAFSRKDIISPRAVNLNALVENGCQSLGRLIGEDIKLHFDLSPDLWSTRLDPTQVDQIIMNMAVNARDAMPNGGTLNFATRNVHIDAQFSAKYADAAPGEYVHLNISDTGNGMDADTLSHVFEPFFTSKEAGKGTGLGLATVYGIVTQNRGFINVTSEPGCGSSFDVYFPRWRETAESDVASVAASISKSGSGTILLVEDDENVRAVTVGMLKFLGYEVIEKSGPEEAISLCSTAVRINLILADVIMPGMNGREMTKRIEAKMPGIPVLYMSGYSADFTSAQGILETGVHFIRKPFDMNSLNKKIASIINPQ